MRILKPILLGAVLVAALANMLGLASPAEIAAGFLGNGPQGRENGILLWGMALGYALAVVNRVPWLDLPRQAVEWLRLRRYLFAWLVCGMACGAFLVLY